MKNMKKFAAGFIAAAMAMSMSLSAFAEVIAPVQNDDMYDNAGNLVLNVSSDEAQITMMAYLVSADTTLDNIPEYSNQTIIALDQNVGNPGFTTIPVDTTKLNADTSIVVKIGGSNGDVATYLIALEKEVVTYSVTFNYNGGTGTPESKEFDDDDTIAEVVAGITPAKDATETETYTFKGWATTADGEVIADTSVAMKSLLAEGEETVTLYAIYEVTAVVPPAVETVTIYVGDVDGDDKVTATDATIIKLYAAQRTTSGKTTVNTNNNATTGATVEVKE